MSAMKASEDALLNEAKASAVANDAIIPRRPHRGEVGGGLLTARVAFPDADVASGKFF